MKTHDHLHLCCKCCVTEVSIFKYKKSKLEKNPGEAWDKFWRAENEPWQTLNRHRQTSHLTECSPCLSPKKF